MSKYKKEIDTLYDWATENRLIRLSEESSFGFLKDKSKIFQMEKLNLADSKLTEVPQEIGCLTNLKELWLNDNQISTLPDEITNLVNLEYLYLDHNPLKELPQNINKLINLKVLEISNTKLKRLSYDTLLCNISKNNKEKLKE